MKHIARLFVASVITQGCAQSHPGPTADALFKTLTSHIWSTSPPDSLHRPGPDYYATTFMPDGTWSTEHVTDYLSPPRTGKWNLERAADGSWYLCRDDGQRHRVILNTDGTLTLTVGRLYPDQPLKPDRRFSAATLPAVEIKPEVEQIANRLTAHRWIRANDLDLRYEPTHVRFSRDWTYVATYRGDECTSRGDWYATADATYAISLVDRCDDRPGSAGDQLLISVIDENRILVNHDLYVPEGTPLTRGTIWRLFGFEQVAIQIEYDMPLRAGTPNNLRVTITNHDYRSLRLDRFSITEKYYDYGRGIGDAGKPVVLPQEIYGKDLESIELALGESHVVALDVTFPKAGLTWVYFNALISGTTQNWDIHNVHEITVAE